MATTVLRTSGGLLDETDRRAFAALINRIGQGEPRILIHVHGGLVDQASAEAIAKRLSGAGPNAYNAPADWEQVYLVWRTGAFETLRENWADLARNDRLYSAILKRLISFLSGRIRSDNFSGRSVFDAKGLTPAEVQRRLDSGDDAPFADIDEAISSPTSGSRVADVDDDVGELELVLLRDTELEDAALNIESSFAVGRPAIARASAAGDPDLGTESLERLDATVRAELSVEANRAAARSIFAGEIFRRVVKHAVMIGVHVLDRYRKGRDHGLHATVAEEIARELYGDLIGSIVWGMMKNNAGDHFCDGAVGAELFLALSSNPNAQVMIIAHSAGSIFASDLLIWAGEHNIPLSIDLVFLAPAVRTLKFAKALGLSEQRISRFRSFLMLDEWERKDVLLGPGLGFVYPSSLLYLVSGLFEEHAAEGLTDAPLVGMARFLNADSDWLNDSTEGESLARLQAYLKAEPSRTVLAKTTGWDGLNSNAVSHGDFDDDPATLASVTYFLSQPRS